MASLHAFAYAITSRFPNSLGVTRSGTKEAVMRVFPILTGAAIAVMVAATPALAASGHGGGFHGGGFHGGGFHAGGFHAAHDFHPDGGFNHGLAFGYGVYPQPYRPGCVASPYYAYPYCTYAYP
jgi:hypothetical protein